ncbi:MAG TPA: hypothetical protein VKX16_09420 [Chloroflexota bacterium]|nr:hypothetical protein [Chloroflexota bacterium]
MMSPARHIPRQLWSASTPEFVLSQEQALHDTAQIMDAVAGAIRDVRAARISQALNVMEHSSQGRPMSDDVPLKIDARDFGHQIRRLRLRSRSL